MREAIIHFSQYRQKSFTGDITDKGEEGSKDAMIEFSRRVQSVVNRQMDVFTSQIRRNKITLINGKGREKKIYNKKLKIKIKIKK